MMTMIGSNTRYVSAALLCGALAAFGCSEDAEPEDLEDLADLDDLADLQDRSGNYATCPHHDHQPPEVIPEPPIELWPPNHMYHVITIDDCIQQVIDCDPHWTAVFLWGTSDEPENSTGDGNTTDDIAFISATAVKVRAERKGNGNGRVYRLKYVVEDSYSNKTFGICTVTVPHDQSGAPAVDSGVAYYEDNPYT